MEFHGRHILVSVDYFSGYISFDPVRSKTAQEVIRTLNNNCRKFWPVKSNATDNGPCFKSAQFKDFCDKLDIRHTTSCPHYHQSNGHFERAIQTVKQMMRKCSSAVELTLAFLAYHDTPISDMPSSPAELMFSRRKCTRLVPTPQESI